VFKPGRAVFADVSSRGGFFALFLGGDPLRALNPRGPGDRRWDLEARCSRTDACSSDARDDVEALRASRTAALLLFGTGGIAMVSGVVVYALSPRGTPATAALGLCPVLAPGAAGLVASGRF
jgi:hypothetical protein